MRGGGPAHQAHHHHAPPSPQLLAALLGDAAPPTPTTPSPLRQLAAIVLNAFARLGRSAGGAGAEASQLAQPVPARSVDDAAEARPLLFVQPPLQNDQLEHTLTPSLVGRPGDGAQPPADDAHVPSSWVPISGGGPIDTATPDDRDLIERISSVLDDVGVTRIQLVVCTVLAPIAVALLIDLAVRWFTDG